MIPNILVPKHELLDTDESQELLEKYKVTRNELPKIKKTDAALTKIKPNTVKKTDAAKTDAALTETQLNTGDIIKITRNNPLVGESYYYRVVVEG